MTSDVPSAKDAVGLQSPASRSNRSSWLRRIALVLVLLTIVSVSRYVFTRVLADRNAVRVHTIATDGPARAGRFEGTLRLAAFNIAHGRGTNQSNWSERTARRTRLGEIAELLQRQRVDIAVLNEVDFDAAWTGHENQAQIIARGAGFGHVMEQRNFDVALPFYRLRFGNAVLSRFPIASARFVKLPPRSRQEDWFAGSKQGSSADIQLDDRTTVRIFAVHLEWRDESTRGRSGEVLSASAADSAVPFFCVGDFNCTPAFASSDPDAGTTALDTLLTRGRLKTVPPMRLSPEQFTFSSFAPTTAIDWILIPPDWDLVNQQVLDIQLSDHRPVFAEVRRQPVPAGKAVLTPRQPATVGKFSETR